MGDLVPITGTEPRTGREFEHFAFLPHHLPDRIALDDETHVRVAEASTALGKLEMASMQVPNPLLFRRPTFRREAQSTSALEGTYAPFEDVLSSEQDSQSGSNLSEVMNYVDASELAFEQIDEREISLGMLKSLQQMLVSGTAAEASDRGGIRDRQVVIGAEGGRVEESRFVPPPPDDRLVSGLQAWESWVQAEHSAITPVVQAAVAHYQFETLHPFSDGNGRIGRLVIVLQLHRLGVMTSGLLSVSPWFEKRRREYQDHLLKVSQEGDWDPWVRFFATAIRDQADATARQVGDLIRLQEHYIEVVMNSRKSGFVLRLANELIGYPFVATQTTADRHGVSYPTVKRAIDHLVELGILEPLSGRTYGKSYVAREVFDLISR